jgi:hypothetical protein
MTGTGIDLVAGVIVGAARMLAQSSAFFVNSGGPNGVWGNWGPSWTVGVWFREPGALAQRATLFDFRGENGVSVDHPSPSPVWRVCFTSADGTTSCGLVEYSPGQWNHFAIRHKADYNNGGPLEVFLNGKLELTLDNPGGGRIFTPATASNTRLGGIQAIDLDDFRAYEDYFEAETFCAALLGGVFLGDCQFKVP